MSTSIPADSYPTATSSADGARWEHTRLRRRLLYGRQADDIRQRIQQAIGSVRREAWGEIDLSSNPFLQTWRQLATLYRQTPRVVAPEGGEVAAVAMAEAGYWSMMARVQRDTLGLREMLVYVDIDPTGSPVYQPIYPDWVEVIAVDPWVAARPVALKVWRRDSRGDWIGYVYDSRGEGYYAALDADGVDVSSEVLRPEGDEGGAYRGEAYPWRVDGAPVLPFVLYHAEDTGQVFDPYTGREVVEGTLQLGVLYTYYNHVVRNAAWGQRYVVGAQPVGASADPTGQRSQIVTDPATLLLLEPMDLDGAGGQVMVGQWTPPVDPEAILRSVIRYERRLVEMAVGGSQVTRETSDIRSGYSLAVSRDAEADARIGYAPTFSRGDLAACRLTAGLLGAPTEGWSISYPGVDAILARQADEGADEGADAGPVIAPEGVAEGVAEGAVEGAAEVAVSFNGAQVAAAQGVVAAVAAGELPRDTGVQMLVAFFGLDAIAADRLMGNVGGSFKSSPTTP